MKVYFLIVAVVLAWCVILIINVRNVYSRKPIVFAQPAAAGVVPSNSIFHKPANADCPAGTTLMRGYFVEEDGTRFDACHNPNGDGSIDYLNPGEGFVIGFDWKTDVQMDSSGKKI